MWEEVIINCPRHIQLLCMSATVKNPDDLGGWISKVWGDGSQKVWGLHIEGVGGMDLKCMGERGEVRELGTAK